MQVTDLYWLTVGNTHHYYTSAQTDITFDNKLWVSQAIDHTGAIEQTDDPLKMDTAFEVAAGTNIANLALNPPANFAVTLQLLRIEGDAPAKVIFTGNIISGVYEKGWVTVELAPLYNALNSNGLHEAVTRQCRYILGSRKCGVALERTAATVLSMSGAVVSLASPLPLQYQYGSLEFDGQAYAIDAQPDSKTLILLHGASIPQGSTVHVRQGCDGTMNHCHGRFNNGPNFGGAEHIPVTNPYTGDPINR